MRCRSTLCAGFPRLMTRAHVVTAGLLCFVTMVLALSAPVIVNAESDPEASAPSPVAASMAAVQPDLVGMLAHTDYDDRTRLELQILQRINDVRGQHSLPPLRLDNRLVAAAREHAVDMAHRHFCRHTGSDRTSVRDRIRRNNYPYNNWAGENILCARRTAEAALQWWMGSTPHRRNILHGHFTHIGVGVSMHGRYGPDMVLVFAAGDQNTIEPDAFRSYRDGNVADWIAATREVAPR